MKIKDLTPGQIVYDVHSECMGNTTMRSVGVWPIEIITVDPEGNWVEAGWNTNRPRRYYAGDVARWKAREPVLVNTGLAGQQRRATREELKAMKAGAK